MKIRTPLIASLLIFAAMAGLSLWAWPQIPDNARIATHFTANGTANGFSGKDFALLFGPGMALGVIVLFCLIPVIEPRRFNLASSAKFYAAAWIAVVAILAVAQTGIVLRALRAPVDAASLVSYALPVMFIVLGNYMGKSHSNFFAGVRTPWTLSSEYSWEKSNRLGGRLLIVAGLLGLVAAFALHRAAAMMVITGSVLAAVAISVVASYFFWRCDPDRHTGDGVPE